MTKTTKAILAVVAVVVVVSLIRLRKRLEGLSSLRELQLPYGPAPDAENLTDPEVSGPRLPDGSLYTQ